MRQRFRGTDWPRLETELNNALEDAYLRGIEEGERRMKKKMDEEIYKLLPPDGEGYPQET